MPASTFFDDLPHRSTDPDHVDESFPLLVGPFVFSSEILFEHVSFLLFLGIDPPASEGQCRLPLPYRHKENENGEVQP